MAGFEEIMRPGIQMTKQASHSFNVFGKALSDETPI